MKTLGMFFAITALSLGLILPARANCGVDHSAKAPDNARIHIAAPPAEPAEEPLKYGLRTGSPAPDFETLTDSGETFKLSRALQAGPVVLVFYRGGWCPFCNKQMNGLKKDLGEFEKRGATLVALSVDQVDKAAETRDKNQLGFPLLSDPDMAIINKYNLAFHLDAPTLEKYQGYGIDVEAASGRTHHQIAVPAVFVIDTHGRIAWSYVNEDYKVRAAADEIFKALDALKKSE